MSKEESENSYEQLTQQEKRLLEMGKMIADEMKKTQPKPTNYVDQLKFLTDRAIVFHDESNKKITIKSKDSRSYLEYIKDPEWNNVKIPKDISIVLEGWLFDSNDKSFGSDHWCFNWLSQRFTIINGMIIANLWTST